MGQIFEMDVLMDLHVFLTAKKKGWVLNHKMGDWDCTKGATFSEKGHFNFAKKQLE